MHIIQPHIKRWLNKWVIMGIRLRLRIVIYRQLIQTIKNGDNELARLNFRLESDRRIFSAPSELITGETF